MPFNGSGSFQPLPPPTFPPVSGNVISSAYFIANLTDIFTGLSNCVTRDGQSPATANLPMGAHKLMGLAVGAANGDSVEYSQLTSTNSAVAAETARATAAETALGAAITTGDSATLSASESYTNTVFAVRATEAAIGTTQLATSAQVLALTDTTLALSPGELGTLLSTTTQKGIIKTAAGSDVTTGTSIDLAVTPKALADAGFGASGSFRHWIRFDSAGVLITRSDSTISCSRTGAGLYLIGISPNLPATTYSTICSTTKTGGSRMSIEEDGVTKTVAAVSLCTYISDTGVDTDAGPNFVGIVY